MNSAVYKKILENIRDAIIVNQDGVNKYVNSRALELLGYDKKEDLVDKGFDLIVHQDDYEKVLDNHLRRLRGEKFKAEYEMVVVSKEGVSIPVEIRVAVFEWEGKPATLNTLIDITDRKKAADALRESTELLQETFKSSRDIIGIFDCQGVVKYISPVIFDLTGHPESFLTGKNIFHFIHPDDIDVAREDFTLLCSNEYGGIPTEFRFRKADGSWICLEALGKNCLDNPAVNGLIISARDISSRKYMETRLLQAQKMEAIGTLAGGIAHNFNNLLMGIQGYISLMVLHKDSADPDVDKLIKMQDLIQNGADLVADLLGFASSGQYELKSTDLNELVSRTVSMFGRTHKEITINQKYAKESWPVKVDRSQIEQVLFHLYVNARQSMPVSGGDIYVETDNVAFNKENARALGIKEGNYVRISITDTGRGMDEDTSRRIFEPYFSSREKEQNVKLGLASAYGVIKGHGGIIDVLSETGRGSIFSIYLPASFEEISTPPERIENISSAGHETILLVDDEAFIVEACSEMLGYLGYHVLTANNGKDSLKIYEKNKDRIDLVILDMIMPRFSGAETFKALQSINPDVKVMLSTGYILSDQVKKNDGSRLSGHDSKTFPAGGTFRKNQRSAGPAGIKNWSTGNITLNFYNPFYRRRHSKIIVGRNSQRPVIEKSRIYDYKNDIQTFKINKANGENACVKTVGFKIYSRKKLLFSTAPRARSCRKKECRPESVPKSGAWKIPKLLKRFTHHTAGPEPRLFTPAPLAPIVSSCPNTAQKKTSIKSIAILPG